jgi:hypothetical protein
LTTLLLIAAVTAPMASTVRQTLEAVLPAAPSVIVAQVESSSLARETLWARVDIVAAPLETLRGPARNLETTLTCRYEEGLPHQRGHVTVSPMVSGSGIEFTLKPGDKVILLIAGTDPNETPCRLLRVESLAARSAIR